MKTEKIFNKVKRLCESGLFSAFICLACASLLAAACASHEKTSGTVDEDDVIEKDEENSQLSCEPGEFIECDGAELVKCDTSGRGDLRVECEFGCNAEESRCNECVAGEVECHGDTLVACDDSGLISAGHECKNGCSSEHLRCMCTPGEEFCEGGVLMLCEADGSAEPLDICVYGCNVDRGECNECDPGKSMCEADVLVECSDDGLIAEETHCSAGCNDEAEPNRCFRFVYTHLEESDLTAGVQTFEPLADVIINTTTKEIFHGGVYVNVPNRIIEGGDPGVGQYHPDIWVLSFKKLTINEGIKVRVVGDRALAIAATEDIIIRGRIDASATGSVPGPGGRCEASPGVLPGDGQSAHFLGCGYSDNGAGGGGYGFFGGSGGGLDGHGSGSAGGEPMGDEEMSVMWGGFRGGMQYGNWHVHTAGAGGGAIILAAGVRIHVAASYGWKGSVDVSGGGGIRLGAGGGSGGTILLEAPEVALGGELSARGGGGSCGAAENASGGDGADSLLSGCSHSHYPNGGQGGGGVGLQGYDGDPGICHYNRGGGGGGGSAGRVRINVAPDVGTPHTGLFVYIYAVKSYGHLGIE